MGVGDGVMVVVVAEAETVVVTVPGTIGVGKHLQAEV